MLQTCSHINPNYSGVLGAGVILPILGYRGEGGVILGYSQNLNSRQTLAGFVDNYDFIYELSLIHI